MIPGELNQTASDEEIAELEMLEAQAGDFEEVENSKLKIGWCTILSNRYSFCALLCIFFGTYNIMFWASWIETYFKRLGNDSLAGTSILFMGLFYLITCFALPY